ncbi:MAG TPA: hypothetical protein VF546_24105 [Pyrinomonadaceae bacterium]|jgi:hypothetical protein
MLTQRSSVRGFLCSVGLDPEILVEFQYNPTQVADKRSVNYATVNAPAQLLPIRQYSRGGDRTLSFTVRLDGLFRDDGGFLDNEVVERRTLIDTDPDLGILPELNKYRAFLYPRTDVPNTLSWTEAGASFIPLYSDTQQFTSPPRCLFGLGQDRVVECIVTEVNVTETLFASNLAPLRADVAVTLVEYSPYETITEPPA